MDLSVKSNNRGSFFILESYCWMVSHIKVAQTWYYKLSLKARRSSGPPKCYWIKISEESTFRQYCKDEPRLGLELRKSIYYNFSRDLHILNKLLLKTVVSSLLSLLRIYS